MEFDFKITTWERITVEPEHEQTILEAIKSGKVKSPLDVYDLIGTEGSANVDTEIMYEHNEPISLEENKGFNTVEVYENGKQIYANGRVK